MTKIIKYYQSNRKFYDTYAQGWTNLRKIEKMVLDNEDIQILKGKEDITNHVLCKILCNKIMEKGQKMAVTKLYFYKELQAFDEYNLSALH